MVETVSMVSQAVSRSVQQEQRGQPLSMVSPAGSAGMTRMTRIASQSRLVGLVGQHGRGRPMNGSDSVVARREDAVGEGGCGGCVGGGGCGRCE
jgi:hypothetical protein